VYVILQDGSIWNNDKCQFLKQSIMGNGYKNVTLYGKTRLVHRVVAEAYIPNPDGLQTVDHVNFDRQDNRVENLQWMSLAANSVRHQKF